MEISLETGNILLEIGNISFGNISSAQWVPPRINEYKTVLSAKTLVPIILSVLFALTSGYPLPLLSHFATKNGTLILN